MKTYELYDHQGALKARVTIDDNRQPEWDFTMDIYRGWWLSEEARAEIVKAIEYVEVHAPNEPSFQTKGFIVRRASP